MTKGGSLQDRRGRSGRQDEDRSFLSSIQDVCCHAECNEASHSRMNEILRFTQDDKGSDQHNKGSRSAWQRE